MSYDLDKSEVEAESTPFNASREETSRDLYRFGIDTIIGGTIQFAAPFHVLSKKILDEAVYRGDVRHYSAGACQADFNSFLSNFFVFSAGFIQIVSERLAEIIRRNTTRSEVRGQTTASLAHAIRTESFGDVEAALQNFATVATSLGIALANTSTLRQSIGGAFVGGGLEFLGTDGADTSFGTAAGAIIGGMLAEARKRNLREATLESAIESVRRITNFIGIAPARLMDQYVSYVFGEKTDFSRRDQETEYGKAITMEVAISCLTVFEIAASIRHCVEEIGRFTDLTSADIFELPLIPKRKREQEAIIRNLVGQMMVWHKYLDQLQVNCAAGITNGAK